MLTPMCLMDRSAGEDDLEWASDSLRADVRSGLAGRRHQIFILYVLMMVLVLLLPVPQTDLTEWNLLDKVVHFGIFLGFALLFYLDRRPRLRWILLSSFAFAGAIELVQWVLPYREGDWADFLAGVAGASVGAVLVHVLARKGERVAAR